VPQESGYVVEKELIDALVAWQNFAEQVGNHCMSEKSQNLYHEAVKKMYDVLGKVDIDECQSEENEGTIL